MNARGPNSSIVHILRPGTFESVINGERRKGPLSLCGQVNPRWGFEIRPTTDQPSCKACLKIDAPRGVTTVHINGRIVERASSASKRLLGKPKRRWWRRKAS